jgi:hypothetical protein
MSEAFVGDLVTPALEGDPRERAQAQVEAYSRSKATAGKHVRNAVYLCPMCSRTFDLSEGEPARADFLPNPESHTNRAVAHRPFDRIVICNGCRYERVLLQVLVGKAPAQTLVLLPHMNIASGAGTLSVQRVVDFVDAATATMTGASTSRVTLGLTGLMADKLRDELPDSLSPDELARLMTYRVSEDTRKRHLRELVKALRDAYDDDLEQANGDWGTTYPSWTEAATALMSDEVQDSEARRLRQEVLKQFPALYHVGETPNLLLVPLPLAIAADEKGSDANRALRELYVLLLIGLTFDVAVVATNEGESVHWTGGEGVARAPAVPAVRALIGEEWVQLEDASGWVRKIGAAALMGPVGKILSEIQHGRTDPASLKGYALHVHMSTCPHGYRAFPQAGRRRSARRRHRLVGGTHGEARRPPYGA